MIHQSSSCLPKKGVRRTTLGVIEPIPGFQQRTNVLPVVQPAQDTCTSNGDPLNHDEIQLVWESKVVKTVDHTKKLEGNLLTGADALMKAIQKPIRPKKKKRFGCRFCKGIFVSSSNLNKHVATYHVCMYISVHCTWYGMYICSA